MRQNPPAELYLDTRRKLISGKSPLTVRVTFTKFIGEKKVWDQRYFPTGYHFTQEEYKKLTSSKTKGAHSENQKNILVLKLKALNIIEDNPFITPDLFRVLFTGEYIKAANLKDLFHQKINALKATNKFGSASSYECALKSIITFHADLNLHAITVQWLKQYEQWMLSQGKQSTKKKDKTVNANSVSTLGIYLRNLRHIFNMAVKQHLVDHNAYPFGKGKYVIPESNNFKKALPKKEKTSFINYKPVKQAEASSHAHWLFSYYCNGMNFKDMAYLKADNINDGVLEYIRRKTKNTERRQTPLTVPLRKEALAILKKYGNHSPYLFGIIRLESEEKQRLIIQQWIKDTNRHVKAIVKNLGLPMKVTTYTARHTVATTLLEAGADLRDIKETFGHSSFATTEKYVASLDISRKKKLVDML